MSRLSSTTDVCMATLDGLRSIVVDTETTKSTWEVMEKLKESNVTNDPHLDPMGSEHQVMLTSNVLRRVLKIIRDEVVGVTSKKQKKKKAGNHNVGDHRTMTSYENMEGLMSGMSSEDGFRDVLFTSELRTNVLDALDELAMEIESSLEEICDQATEHIHDNEVILTLGQSRTVETFLKKAAKNRKFQVMVAENAPSYTGHAMASSLASTKSIETTVIPDSAMMAVMSRVNKVMIGAQAIMADGGLKASVGSFSVALAAKHYSVPLYVCASLVKLTPSFYTCDTNNSLTSPDTQGLPTSLTEVEVVAPIFEYVPPQLVTLFVDNIAGHAPTYVYRLLSELYHPEDYQLLPTPTH